mgnify:FL=1
MMNPHINIGERPKAHLVPLNSAIDYANLGKDAYANALGEQAEFNSYLGIGLTALGGAALGLGVAGGGTTAITILGLTGASAYGVGSFLENKPRQRAYILGYNAINCAVEAVLPLNVCSSPSYKHFTQALHGKSGDGNLLSHIESTEKAISKVRKINATVNISRSISAAESLVKTAKIAYANGVNLDLKINNSGSALIASVDRIVGQVNDSINANQADLQSIVTIIGGLGGMYSQFTMVPQSTTSASEIKSESKALIQSANLSPQQIFNRAALNELLNNAAALSRTTQIITAFVNAIVAEKPIEQLKMCGVSPDDIASNIEVDPAGDIEFIRGKGGSTGRVIQGGSSPYSATVASSSAKGISVKQSIPFAPMFVVEATPEAMLGDYSIYVTDGAGHRKFVTVRIANDSVKDTNGSNNNVCSSPPEAWTSVSANEQKNIQQALCATDDGIWGCKTLEKLNQFKIDKKLSDDSIAITNLLKLTDEEKQKRCGTTPPTSGSVSLKNQALHLGSGLIMHFDGLIIIINKATLNETKKVIDLELHLDKNPSKEISKQELINEIIKQSSVTHESKDLNITNFEDIKANLKPAS